MTDTEKKFKVAFMILLEHYQTNISDALEWDEANNFCTRYCPFASAPGERDCPALVCEEYYNSDYDAYEVDKDKCREEIFKWYVEKANGCLRD